MDSTRKLNREAFWFVIINTVLILNIAIEFYSYH